jgi:acylphosphatase
MSDRQAIRLRVRGKVQGVGFRWFTREAARELGVVGRVRNLADGSVEIEAAASDTVLERFKERVRQGPRGGSVDTLEEESLTAVPAWDRFEIER